MSDELTFVLLIIYLFSILIAFVSMLNRDIECNIVSLLCVLIPVLNTVVSIVYLVGIAICAFTYGNAKSTLHRFSKTLHKVFNIKPNEENKNEV